MSNNRQIHLEKMIVHKIEHKTFEEPQFADLESPISEEVAGFLRKHITSISNHKHTRTGQFSDTAGEGPDIRQICDELLGDDDQFVARSRQIANHLFESVDGRMSESDLLICSFVDNGDARQGSGNGNPAKWAALLKLDPADGFVGEREEEDGLVRYVLRRVPDVLPTGELQKSALVASATTREQLGYDLKVLDQQAARYGGHRLVASFFIKDFLNCKVWLNRKDKSKAFLLGSYAWVAKKAEDWPEGDVERFKLRAASALQENIVDLTEFAKAVIEQADEQEEYLKFMLETQGMDDLTFEPDPEERRRLLKYSYFEGDNGLRVRIESDAIGPDATMQMGERDETGMRTITIRTSEWRKLPKRGR